MKKILVTGGAGYIGSTVAWALHDAGFVPIILDSLITGQQKFVHNLPFYKGDIGDLDILNQIFNEHPNIEHAIHCAGLILVPESVQKPALYYTENVSKTIILCDFLRTTKCQHIVFSSSASVYDSSQAFQATENTPLLPQSPYARTKAMTEEILKDFSFAYGLHTTILRYFNPVGADPKKRCGLYQIQGTHLLEQLCAVALGRQASLCITGNDWPTRDGTGIRDYIHVWDLALAHVLAVQKHTSVLEKNAFLNPQLPHYSVFNLGTSTGTSVKEFVQIFETIWNKPISVVFGSARPGDVMGLCAVATRAKEWLAWEPNYSIAQAVAHTKEWLDFWL